MIIEILYLEEARSILDFDELFATDKILPIIWNNQGKYKIVPTAVIKNKINLGSRQPFVINWYEAQDIDVRIVRLLLDK